MALDREFSDYNTAVKRGANIDATIEAVNLTTSGNTTLGDAAGDTNTYTGTNQFNNTVTVGVDGTGYDVIFYGATAGQKVFWDESADTLNLDCTTQVDGTITVGVDDTGYDVKFFGATAGAYMLWDESADDLILAGAAGLSVAGASAFTGNVTFGVDDTGVDVTFYGATASANVTWDESDDALEFNGAAILTLGTSGAKTSTANTLVPVMFTAATEVIAAGTGGAISVACYCSHISADAGGDAFTIASGTVVGQRKRIYFLATAGGTGVVTGAFRGADNTLTFTNAGEYAELIWDGTDWLDVELGSTDDTNIATPPALSTV